MRNNPLKYVWQHMKQRCYNPNSNAYHNYGGRGINICQEWLTDKNKFFSWAFANGYEKGLQIDRINNDGNYEPNNCRFVTPKVNNNNRRNNSKVTVNGETLTYSQWADKIGVPVCLIHTRIKQGWEPIKAVKVEKQIVGYGQRKAIICINTGKYYESQKDAARDLNIRQGSISNVISKRAKSACGYAFELAV